MRPTCSQILTMPSVQQHLKKALKQLGIDAYECKENLLDTIKVPLKFNIISTKLPNPQYSDRQALRRNSSETANILHGNKESVRYLPQGALPITVEKKIDVCRSADNSVDYYAKNHRQNLVKNEPKGYRGDHKENGRPPQSSYLRVHGTVDKSYLQKYGAAIIS